MERSKELNDITDAIERYIKKYEGNVQFIGSIMAFKGKEFEVVDDLLLGYGFKDTMLIDLKDLTKMVKKEKKEFINW